MNEIRFRLNIAAHEYEAYYAGIAKNVIVPMQNGQNLQFPASNLRSYFRHDGVHGEFVLRFDENNKLVELVRLED